MSCYGPLYIYISNYIIIISNHISQNYLCSTLNIGQLQTNQIDIELYKINKIIFVLSAYRYSVKRSDVTGNPFEWLLGKNNVIYVPLSIRHFIR